MYLMKTSNTANRYFDPIRLSIARQGSFRVNKDGFTFFDTNAKGAGFGNGSLEVVSI